VLPYKLIGANKSIKKRRSKIQGAIIRFAEYLLENAGFYVKKPNAPATKTHIYFKVE
jgi:hypothetical protein